MPIVGLRQIYVDNIKIYDRNIGFRINSYGPIQKNVAGIFRTVMKQTDALIQNFSPYNNDIWKKTLKFSNLK